MTYAEAKNIIINWLNSGENISLAWRTVLSLCLRLIDEKINNNNEK